MLDYKSIIIKHYVLNMSGRSIAKEMGISKSGVNDFLNTAHAKVRFGEARESVSSEDRSPLRRR